MEMKIDVKSLLILDNVLIHVYIQRRSHLKLGLRLGLLEDGLHLGGLHDITLDLQLAAHEQLLRIGLAGDELGEVLVGEVEGDCRECQRQFSSIWSAILDCDIRTGGLGTCWGSTLANGSGLLQVDVPAVLGAGALDVEGEDGTALLDGILALGLVNESRGDEVESGRGRDGVCRSNLLADRFIPHVACRSMAYRS